MAATKTKTETKTSHQILLTLPIDVAIHFRDIRAHFGPSVHSQIVKVLSDHVAQQAKRRAS